MKSRIAWAIAGIAWFTFGEAHAQSYAEEALIFSRTRSGGTARIQAMGGVQNALGGDISSAYYNPAGLGMYNRSEVSITPGYGITTFNSTYFGNTATDNKTALMIPNLGVAFHAGQDGSSGVGIWGGTLGISFNRINDFNETFSYAGTNPDNSIIDYFISEANGENSSQFSPSGALYNTPTGLAFFTYLIGPQDILVPPGPPDKYFTDVTGIPQQSEVVKTTGAQNQWNLSYGINFNDKVFLGAGLGIATLRYTSEKTYTETFSDAGQPMDVMELRESLVLDGSGINLTVGVIYRPINSLQLGFSAATPTSFEIDENYSAAMEADWNDFEYIPGKTLTLQSAFTDNLNSTHALRTPWRLSLGSTYFFQKKGLISADIEWLNYRNARFDGDDFAGNNDQIASLYKSTFNIRVGGEYRLKSYRFRVGYNLMADPFQSPQNGVNRSIASYSAGAGYRTAKFYVDFAAILATGQTSYRPYQLEYPLDPLVKQRRTSTTLLITVGFPF